jgi:acid phosphatase class B
MNALDRLKAQVFREGTDLAIVNRHDLAKLIAVAEAAQSYVDRAGMTTMFDIVQALAALTEDHT